jgi:uncharacterized SAM-binding protein YcdF (DUF218 family)
VPRFAKLLETPLRVAHAFEPLDAIVVLGAPLRSDGGLTSALQDRVDAAAALYRRGGGRIVVVTGGTTHGAPRAEAAAMAEALAPHVPRDALLVEDAALTTAENARFTAAMLAPLGARRVWLVTQPFHTRRAAYLFARAGLEPRAWPARGVAKLRWVAREYAAWVAMPWKRR